MNVVALMVVALMVVALMVVALRVVALVLLDVEAGPEIEIPGQNEVHVPNISKKLNYLIDYKI